VALLTLLEVFTSVLILETITVAKATDMISSPGRNLLIRGEISTVKKTKTLYSVTSAGESF